eukprot:1237345-Rhodomonas_salina.2
MGGSAPGGSKVCISAWHCSRVVSPSLPPSLPFSESLSAGHYGVLTHSERERAEGGREKESRTDRSK